jgi:hypothetical protein
MATIISKTSYGDDTAYDSGGDVMAKRRGNNEAHLIEIDASTMESRRVWQNWLNETAYLNNTGVVDICDCPFSTQDDPELVKENVFNQ